MLKIDRGIDFRRWPKCWHHIYSNPRCIVRGRTMPATIAHCSGCGNDARQIAIEMGRTMVQHFGNCGLGAARPEITDLQEARS